ncbi:MAG TPA: succinate dehydrogenase, hydrophobic membrane anchor protein [Alphaproteobacteria bacterium]|jgi:succinate dehydrogenase / fumarate reductase, membrane anchor subunit|nr:succinate dehydrogenase, hydrophobic membrane anchor protein [Alphaproteobacteria bacterium]
MSLSNKPQFKTPIGRVRGRGSAKDGTAAFWHQRLTALALIPLSVLCIGFMIALTGADYASAAAAMRSPLAGVLMLMFLLVGFYHMSIGLTHIVDDYVHWELGKLGLNLAIKLGCLGLGLACILSVLKLSFGGAA